MKSDGGDMKLVWWFLHMLYEMRSRRAARRSRLFKAAAEKFFRKARGGK